jgi:6,7-dimethyl-8-ribityllumazine synthase
MLITFKSKAAGDVMMFGDVATQMLRLMGKAHEPKGIITVEQIPDAIARLKQAAAEAKAHAADKEEPRVEKVPGGSERPYVSIALRAVPLIELLERARQAKEPVTWGV